MEQKIELNALMSAMNDFARMSGAASVKCEFRFGYFALELRASFPQPGCQDTKLYPSGAAGEGKNG